MHITTKVVSTEILLKVALNTINQTISWWSVLIVEEPGENHRPVSSHCQTLSLDVVSSTPRHERGSNAQL